MSPFSVAPLRCPMQHQHELHFHLYLHRNVNNLTVASTHHGGCDPFGNIVVNDWPIYDGHGHGAKVVAHAQGLHIHSSKEGNGTSNSFTIFFQVERYKGSTLEVMGNKVTGGQWAIVGGTGEFTMAQGVIYKKEINHCNSDIVELDIHALYTPISKGHKAGWNKWNI